MRTAAARVGSDPPRTGQSPKRSSSATVSGFVARGRQRQLRDNEGVLDRAHPRGTHDHPRRHVVTGLAAGKAAANRYRRGPQLLRCRRPQSCTAHGPGRPLCTFPGVIGFLCGSTVAVDTGGESRMAWRPRQPTRRTAIGRDPTVCDDSVRKGEPAAQTERPTCLRRRQPAVIPRTPRTLQMVIVEGSGIGPAGGTPRSVTDTSSA